MKKRIAAIFMAACIVFSMCTPLASAVTPADPLIASALYTFVLSAGYRLFREGGISDSDLATEQLTEDIKTLFNEFNEDTGGMDWTQFGLGVTVGDAGNFIYNYSSALTAQSFADWLARKNPGANTSTILIDEQQSNSGGGEYGLSDDQLARLPAYQNNCWELPVVTSGGEVKTELSSDKYYYVYSANASYYVTEQQGQSILQVHFISTTPFTVSIDRYRVLNDEEVLAAHSTYNAGTITVPNVLDPNDGTGYTYYTYNVARNDFSTAFNINYIIGKSGYYPVKEMGYAILTGYAVNNNLIGDLIGRLAGSLTNQVYGLTQDQAIAIDVGAGVDADEETVVDVVSGEYALPETTTISTPIATPVPIEGVTEPYPQPSTTDIDNLGLPDLGQALTNRFPFCIPFDVASVFRSLNATAVCPVIEVDLFPASFKSRVGITGDTSFTIDFGDQKYALFIKLIHWGSLTGFILTLAYVTKRLVWTSGG